VKVPLLDVKAQNAPLREAIMAAIACVVDGGAFILGPEVAAFENELAVALGTRRAVGLSSGTDALLVALMALDVRPGDEVVTTPYSFFATVGCIARLGARPVFADIDPETFNLDEAAAAAACGPRTRAVIPVHLFGRPAILPKVAVPIVEDAAQAIGACRVAGIASCLSFFPSKNLGAFGDGGALLTDDDGFADVMARYCDGEARAFEELYAGLAPRILGYLRAMVGEQAAAEDLLQLTFMKLHRSRATYVRGANPVPWLYTIAHRTCIDEMRRRTRSRVRLSQDGELPHEPTVGITGTAEVEGSGEDDAAMARGLAALASLPYPLRQAVVLIKIHGHSSAEAASIVRMSFAPPIFTPATGCTPPARKPC